MLRGGAEVARQAHNLKAVGSIPAPATITISASLRTGFFYLRIFCHCKMFLQIY